MDEGKDEGWAADEGQEIEGGVGWVLGMGFDWGELFRFHGSLAVLGCSRGQGGASYWQGCLSGRWAIQIQGSQLGPKRNLTTVFKLKTDHMYAGNLWRFGFIHVIGRLARSIE